MQSEFRKVITDGDLILQEKGRWWPFYGDKWYDYRNESEEVRLLKQHMDNAFMRYKEMQNLFVVAQKNVQTDTQLLQMYKVDNSEVEYVVSCEQSILEERDGIKYSNNRGNNSGRGNGGGSNQNQRNNQNGNGNQQQSKKGKQQQSKPMSIFELLMNAKVVMPNQQRQVS